jgi:hypothetical protein
MLPWAFTRAWGVELKTRTNFNARGYILLRYRGSDGGLNYRTTGTSARKNMELKLLNSQPTSEGTTERDEWLGGGPTHWPHKNATISTSSPGSFSRDACGHQPQDSVVTPGRIPSNFSLNSSQTRIWSLAPASPLHNPFVGVILQSGKYWP